MSRAIGLILTITGLLLCIWFIQAMLVPGPTPLPNYVVAAIAVAMLSVGIRYIFKKKKQA